MEDEAPEGEIRAISAAVQYDGSIAVLLEIPGEPEPVEHRIEGDSFTVLLTHHGASRDVDLRGATATDRRCLEIVARGVRRLNEEMDRQRERLGRQRAEWPDED